MSPLLIAVDIGNSRIKLGCFDRAHASGGSLPEPVNAVDLAIVHATGEFDVGRLAAWCGPHVGDQAEWVVASVHRGAAERLAAAVGELGRNPGRRWSLRQLTYRDVPLQIQVEAPERVGIDRLLAAVAANHVRTPDRAAIIVEVGTAITVDVVGAGGAFLGGSILPGLSLSARALQEQTDALPRVAVDLWRQPPEPLGKSTVAAIESGLFWGAVGAIRVLAGQFSAGLALPPEMFISGGGSNLIAAALAESSTLHVRHEPHLVLSGIGLVEKVEG